MTVFTKPLSEETFGDLIPLQEFLDDVACGGFIDDDGFGLPVKDDMVADWGFDPRDDHRVWPSQVDKIPAGTTDILWFNR